MDWTAARATRRPAGGLPAKQLNEAVHDSSPDEHVPEHPRDDRNVELDSRRLGSRVQGFTLLSLIVVVQLGWLATLAYALFRLVS